MRSCALRYLHRFASWIRKRPGAGSLQSGAGACACHGARGEIRTRTPFGNGFLRPSCLPFHHSGASRYFTKRPGNRQDRFRAQGRVFVASASAKGYPFKSKQYLTLKGPERARNGMEPVYRHHPGRRACSCCIRGISRLSFVDGKGRMSRGRLLFENEDAAARGQQRVILLRFEHRLADRRGRRTRKRALRAFRRQVGRTCDNGPDSFAGRPAGQCA